MEVPVIRHTKEPSSFPYLCADTERALLLLDESGIIKYCSPGVANCFCVNPQAIIGQPVTGLLPGLPIGARFPGFSLACNTFHLEGKQWLAFSGQDNEGREFPLKAALVPLEIDGRPFFLLELRTQRALAGEDEKLQKFQEVSELSDDAVAVTTMEGLIEYVNPAFEELTGYRKDELVGRTHAILNSGVHEPAFFLEMWTTLRAGRSFRGQFVNRRQNGALFYEDKIIRPFYNASGKMSHFMASGRDVSEQVQIMHRLEHLANYDSLTGLPNRNLFLDRLQQAEARGSRNHDGFAIVLLDLDHFKAINDTLGHAVGDAVLQTTAFRIRQCLREGDTVARLGGDEFSLILTEVALRQDVMKVLEKIVALLGEPLIMDSQNIPVQASIGIAIYPEHGEDGQTLLKHADSAMYRVKTAGGNDYLIFERKEEGRPIYSLQK
ncbi:hypothetical protein TPL01_28200 [Sulfuriferula plumbiphila]|uniref:Diguanylate cyclase n=1 Tax=Sulfuriferula plumbiphila TaxID=171865 RepID=A0A512LB59_9PROT|nr:diguanylate cyclase [Sulfuriferula plumbiphila]BBP03895.1 hypothetical protein SFPGR_13170 [Sulfuriferula plumbiphila]GEP31682.1 hypothetical protein TPL01_28200 [Sulfuriferula plumbiphila]